MGLASEISRLLGRGLYSAADFLVQLLPPEAVIQQPPASKHDMEVLSLFNLKEYERCAQLARYTNGASSCSAFLGNYAKYLHLAKQGLADLFDDASEAKQEASEAPPQAAPKGGCLQALTRRLSTYSDPYSRYLAGEIELHLGHKEAAQSHALESLREAPLNWSCWLVLLETLSAETFHEACLPEEDTLLKDFFLVRLYSELEIHRECVERLLAKIEESTGPCYFTEERRCFLSYQKRDFKEALEGYRRLSEKHPYRLDHVDTQANILFVEGSLHELTILGHRTSSIDRYRPETCIVLGNWHSLRGAHEEAILFFRRVLRLSPAYITAWTLMGHEYIELSNISAGIICYRNAVGQNKQDYRAWYGLGQAYEMLRLPTYALYYYRMALAIKSDERIQEAILECAKMC